MHPVPDFLVIGAQKAGTSWLHRALQQCPSVFVPDDKDFEYFSFPGGTPEQQFLARFKAAPRGCRVGDVCASYFWTVDFGVANPHFNRDIPATVREALGSETRILVLLRDPVQRALSAYMHHIAFGAIVPATPILEAPSNLGIVAMSRYGANLVNWLRHFPAERLTVLPSPGEAPAAEIFARVCRVLELDRDTVSDVDSPVFPGLPRIQDADGLWVSAETLGTLPPGRRIEDHGDSMRVCLVEPDEIERLTNLLQPDIAQLAELLGPLQQVDPAFCRWTTWPSHG
jgi:hypothetical protein